MLSWLGFVETSQLNEIKYYDDAPIEEAIIGELSDLFAKLNAQPTPGADSDGIYFSILIVGHVLQALQKNGPSYVMRMASESEYREAGVPADLKDKNGNRLKFYFLETYGYRITFFLDLSTLRGLGFDIAKSSEETSVILRRAADNMGL